MRQTPDRNGSELWRNRQKSTRRSDAKAAPIRALVVHLQRCPAFSALRCAVRFDPGNRPRPRKIPPPCPDWPGPRHTAVSRPWKLPMNWAEWCARRYIHAAPPNHAGEIDILPRSGIGQSDPQQARLATCQTHATRTCRPNGHARQHIENCGNFGTRGRTRTDKPCGGGF